MIAIAVRILHEVLLVPPFRLRKVTQGSHLRRHSCRHLFPTETTKRANVNHVLYIISHPLVLGRQVVKVEEETNQLLKMLLGIVEFHGQHFNVS
jgi:hypothetical protein